MMETAEQIIEDILDMELEMFLTVPSEGPSTCQQHPERFKFHRRLQFSIQIYRLQAEKSGFSSLESAEEYKRQQQSERFCHQAGGGVT